MRNPACPKHTGAIAPQNKQTSDAKNFTLDLLPNSTRRLLQEDRHLASSDLINRLSICDTSKTLRRHATGFPKSVTAPALVLSYEMLVRFCAQ